MALIVSHVYAATLSWHAGSTEYTHTHTQEGDKRPSIMDLRAKSKVENLRNLAEIREEQIYLYIVCEFDPLALISAALVYE